MIIGAGSKLTGRNEIRLANNARVTLQGGQLSSLRWVDVMPGAVIAGHGAIDADLFTAGTVSTSSAGSLKVSGTANLGGILHVPAGETVKSGTRIPVIEAKAIHGKFDQVDARFSAEYTSTSVTLVAK